MARYLGVDLHRNCFTVCTRTKEKKTGVQTWQMKALPDFVKSWLTIPNEFLVIEKISGFILKKIYP